MTSCNSILKRKLLEVNYSFLILSGCLKFFSSGVLLFYFSNCWQSSIIGHHHHHFCWNIWENLPFKWSVFSRDFSQARLGSSSNLVQSTIYSADYCQDSVGVIFGSSNFSQFLSITFQFLTCQFLQNTL